METVAIVGRPNVGKSTLFNRLTGERKSIVDDQSGVTRDRLYGTVNWGGIDFNIIDTGGWVPDSDDVFEAAIREQVTIAMEESSLILFVVDVTTGITHIEDVVTEILRKTNKRVIVVVNKVDNGKRLIDATEFYSLGFEELFSISSINGSGTGELLDAIIQDMQPEEEIEEDEIPKIVVLGQPNAGKSSLINAFLGEERNVVTDIAGTTRDTINTRFKKFGKDLILIDTAGLRKKTKVHENLEFYSVIRAVRTLDKSDVCILMIDATKGITSQDINIFSLAARKSNGIVIVVNKWDLVKDKETNTAKEYEEELRRRIQPFDDVPIIFSSVLEKKRIMKILDIAEDVYNRRKQRITTSKLNEFLQKTMERYGPPMVKGKMVTIKYVTMLKTRTPSFVFFCNHPKYLRPAYKNYLENRIRSEWNFTGVPFNVYYREK